MPPTGRIAAVVRKLGFLSRLLCDLILHPKLLLARVARRASHIRAAERLQPEGGLETLNVDVHRAS
jgi:hypothetical protein